MLRPSPKPIIVMYLKRWKAKKVKGRRKELNDCEGIFLQKAVSVKQNETKHYLIFLKCGFMARRASRAPIVDNCSIHSEQRDSSQ